jgi:cytochrome c biogenesis factor
MDGTGAPAAQTQFLLIAVSFACLAQSFLANDFSVAYVANHSNTRCPRIVPLLRGLGRP